ncbi:hypothetical protein C943_01441 [Mariniradius saccharolyticus AK6]|uniref:Uncharacterized protein n=1 Tax=Mariniradius saccharolyticus AK6 TaxID=1239962 RepID=M7XBA6_9BACT|nr:hypothetical protein C943_01441 [Mariniradius saccharolyticus AK6]
MDLGFHQKPGRDEGERRDARGKKQESRGKMREKRVDCGDRGQGKGFFNVSD